MRALVEDDGSVEAADDLLKGDVFGGPGKPDPASDASPSGDEARPVELRDDAACERVRDEQVFAEAAGRDAFAARPASQLHQDANSIVGASRDFRDPSECGRAGSLLSFASQVTGRAVGTVSRRAWQRRRRTMQQDL